MALTAKRLDTRAVGTSLATHYTAPGSTKARITEVTLCNTTTADITIRVHFVPSGGSADTTNAILYDFPVPPGVPFIIPLNSWLNTGDFIRMVAASAGIAATISGIEEA